MRTTNSASSLIVVCLIVAATLVVTTHMVIPSMQRARSEAAPESISSPLVGTTEERHRGAAAGSARAGINQVVVVDDTIEFPRRIATSSPRAPHDSARSTVVDQQVEDLLIGAAPLEEVDHGVLDLAEIEDEPRRRGAAVRIEGVVLRAWVEEGGAQELHDLKAILLDPTFDEGSRVDALAQMEGLFTDDAALEDWLRELVEGPYQDGAIRIHALTRLVELDKAWLDEFADIADDDLQAELDLLRRLEQYAAQQSGALEAQLGRLEHSRP